MKVNTQEKSMLVQTSGGLQEMEFGIKSCDVGFIMQLLRNDMYKYPIDAICREIASNARDANREAGKSDVPIDISITKNPFLESDFSINFSDIGPGISPDRMQNIFLNYGASTKRDTNEQTGGFGLGAKTPFAYTSSFCIETVYDCKKYIYAAVVKDGNKGRMYLLNEEICYDDSGTVVSVPINKNDIENFEHSAYRSTIFWNPRPVYHNFTSLREVSEYKPILKNDDFTLVAEFSKDKNITFSRNSNIVALLDGIPYEIDNPDIGTNALNDTLLNLTHSGINALLLCDFNIGEVTISPNRETLQYNDKTNKKIKENLNKITDVLVSSSLSIIKRTTTLIDRIIFSRFLINKGWGLLDVINYRPFNNFTKEEIALAFIGAKFARKSKIKSFDIAFDGLDPTKHFSSIFKGLSLKKVIESYSTRTGKRSFKSELTSIKEDFFKNDVFLLDCKRNRAKDKGYYDRHNKVMILIEPSNVINTYKKMILELKAVYRKSYNDTLKSIKLLDKSGIIYKPYSSIEKAAIKYKRKSKHGFRMFPAKVYGFSLKDYDPCVESLLIKEEKKDKLITDIKDFPYENSVYYPMKDLRKVKMVQSDLDLQLFKLYYLIILKKDCKILYVKEKDVAPINKLKSVYSVLNQISLEERTLIANIITLSFNNTYHYKKFKDIKFSSKRYSEAKKKIDRIRSYNYNKMFFRDRFLQSVKSMEKYADIKEDIEIMEEAVKKFPLLETFYDDDLLEHMQMYVNFFEGDLISKGEIE